MSNLQWYDYLRMLTMLMTLISLYVSGHHAIRQWDKYTNRLKSLWWAFNAFLLLMFEGSLEQILQNATWGPRTLLSFIVSGVALRAILQGDGFLKDERSGL